jgi:hypothetical protein
MIFEKGKKTVALVQTIADLRKAQHMLEQALMMKYVKKSASEGAASSGCPLHRHFCDFEAQRL